MVTRLGIGGGAACLPVILARVIVGMALRMASVVGQRSLRSKIILFSIQAARAGETDGLMLLSGGTACPLARRVAAGGICPVSK